MLAVYFLEGQPARFQCASVLPGMKDALDFVRLADPLRAWILIRTESDECPPYLVADYFRSCKEVWAHFPGQSSDNVLLAMLATAGLQRVFI